MISGERARQTEACSPRHAPARSGARTRKSSRSGGRAWGPIGTWVATSLDGGPTPKEDAILDTSPEGWWDGLELGGRSQ